MEDKKRITENGITYYLAEDGMYYPEPQWRLVEEYPIGKYGIRFSEYIMEHKRYIYVSKSMDGTWNRFLHEIDEECHEREEIMEKQLMKAEGITEELKKTNQLEWVGRVNEIRMRVERMVVEKLLVNNLEV